MWKLAPINHRLEALAQPRINAAGGLDIWPSFKLAHDQRARQLRSRMVPEIDQVLFESFDGFLVVTIGPSFGEQLALRPINERGADRVFSDTDAGL